MTEATLKTYLKQIESELKICKDREVKRFLNGRRMAILILLAVKKIECESDSRTGRSA